MDNVLNITYNSTSVQIYVTTDGERFYDYYTACEHQRLLNELQPIALCGIITMTNLI